MLYLSVFYWSVTGTALFMMPTENSKYNFIELVACFLLGGIVVPAGLLVRFITNLKV